MRAFYSTFIFSNSSVLCAAHYDAAGPFPPPAQRHRHHLSSRGDLCLLGHSRNPRANLSKESTCRFSTDSMP